MQEEFYIDTLETRCVIDLTDKVESIVSKSKIKEGICLVYATHATCAIIVNEYEPRIAKDFLDFFSKLVPKSDWCHNQIDDNAEAHIKSALLHSGKTIPVRDSSLLLGTWQRIMLLEFDGPRNHRRIVVQVTGQK